MIIHKYVGLIISWNLRGTSQRRLPAGWHVERKVRRASRWEEMAIEDRIMKTFHQLANTDVVQFISTRQFTDERDFLSSTLKTLIAKFSVREFVPLFITDHMTRRKKWILLLERKVFLRKKLRYAALPCTNYSSFVLRFLN